MSKHNQLITFQKEGSITTGFVLECLQQWTKALTKPTVLVLDNTPIHQAKSFLAQLEHWQQQNLFIFFLPTYCPHLNMIETLCGSPPGRKVKYEWLKPTHYASFIRPQRGTKRNIQPSRQAI